MKYNEFIENEELFDCESYYDGWITDREKKLSEYLKECKIIDEIEEVRSEILSCAQPDIIKTRGRHIEKYDYTLDEYIYYSDIIMDVYAFRYNYENFDFDELKNYFISGEFLNDAEEYLKSLNYFHGRIKASRSLKDGSKGERLLKDILEKEKYIFKEQECDGCYNDCTLNPLFFDFIIYINNVKIYVEIQGMQHYKPVSFHGEDYETQKDNFRYQKIRDVIKKKFAEEHGIFIELDYREGNLNKLEDRINNQLLPILKELRGV